ncbi:MAG TPA: hypothetical protein VLF59_05080 [Candidatus Saccharimonadales bacterium]|nr:hypothetical protein [Candidatus Saccharimonadales bacterium]
MKPNHGGGFTLTGSSEITAAQWAVVTYRPVYTQDVEDDRRVWDNEADKYTLPLGPGETAGVLDAVEIAYAMKKSSPSIHRRPIRNMLIDGGRREPVLYDKIRRLSGQILATLAEVD